MRGKLRVRSKSSLFRTATAGDQSRIRTAEQIAERDSFRDSFGFYENAATIQREIFRFVSKKR